jgi:hypothetical protein
MIFLVIKAFAKLVQIEFSLRREDFAAVHNQVHKYPTARKPASAQMIEPICRAINLACICYWKHVLCLQRSAATICLLRAHGISAQMVIGTQAVPFRSHAWVELDGRVINDEPGILEMYSVLERC